LILKSKEKGVTWIILLSLYLLIVNMILPILPYSESWYKNIEIYPEAWGIFSVILLVNIVITLYVMIFYARGFIVRAFHNYVDYHVTNMETLIALGSISAFSLFLFFIIRYSIDYY
jgi:cation transport ATPase